MAADIHGDPRGSWFTTFTGRTIRPRDLEIADVDIRDIAWSLAHINRYGGHALVDDYSVAEHSVLCSRLIEPRWALEALMHDAAEAYTGDLVTAIKYNAPGFRAIEDSIETIIRDRFGLEGERPPEVKRTDLQLLAAELGQLVRPTPDNVREVGRLREEYGTAVVSFYLWPPLVAYHQFMTRYCELTR